MVKMSFVAVLNRFLAIFLLERKKISVVLIGTIL